MRTSVPVFAALCWMASGGLSSANVLEAPAHNREAQAVMGDWSRASATAMGFSSLVTVGIDASRIICVPKTDATGSRLRAGIPELRSERGEQPATPPLSPRLRNSLHETRDEGKHAAAGTFARTPAMRAFARPSKSPLSPRKKSGQFPSIRQFTFDDISIAEQTRPISPPLLRGPMKRSSSELRLPALPGRGYVVQIGAYRSQAAAERDLNSQLVAHASLLSGRQHWIQKATFANGETWYRLLLDRGSDHGAAEKFCDALKVAGVNCLPVRV